MKHLSPSKRNNRLKRLRAVFYIKTINELGEEIPKKDYRSAISMIELEKKLLEANVDSKIKVYQNGELLLIIPRPLKPKKEKKKKEKKQKNSSKSNINYLKKKENTDIKYSSIKTSEVKFDISLLKQNTISKYENTSTDKPKRKRKV